MKEWKMLCWQHPLKRGDQVPAFMTPAELQSLGGLRVHQVFPNQWEQQGGGGRLDVGINKTLQADSLSYSACDSVVFASMSFSEQRARYPSLK